MKQPNIRGNLFLSVSEEAFYTYKTHQFQNYQTTLFQAHSIIFVLQCCKKNIAKYDETLFSFLFHGKILPLHPQKNKA